MICNKCNAQNDDAGKFCVKCGSPLSSPSLEKIAQKDKKSYVFYIFAFLAVLVIVVGGSYMLYFRGSAKDFFPPAGTTKVWQYTTGNKSMIYQTFGGEIQFQGKTVTQILRKYNVNVLGKKQTGSKSYYEVSGSAWKHVATQDISSQDTETGEILLFEPPYSVFRYPLNQGYIWEEKIKQSRSKDNYNEKKPFDITFRVLGMEEVEVPAGKYNTWKIEATVKVDGEIVRKETEWYAKNIGSIKSNIQLKDNKYIENVLISVNKSGGK